MMKIKKSRFITIIILTAAISVFAAFGGILLFGKLTGSRFVDGRTYEKYESAYERFEKMEFMMNTINEGFLWDVDEEEIMDILDHTLMDSLGDKYSVYMDREETKSWDQSLAGKMSGIGVSISLDDKEQLVILYVYEKSPAAGAGLKEGDIITAIDGKKYKTTTEAASATRGEPGTKVEVTYLRDGKETTVTMTRAQLDIKSVTGEVLDGNIGYIRISSFGANTAKDFKAELRSMEDKKVDGLIIDLRNNGGGYVEAALSVADELLPECTVTQLVDRDGTKEYKNSKVGCTDLKYVVLVNQNSASASELLAAGVKENEGGKLIGTTTYGKGVVQVEYHFKDGSSFKITTQEYLSPKGNTINEKGVEPDIKVEKKSTDKDDQLEAAKNALKS